MSKVNSTIRQARNAVNLVLSGALRDIENEFGPEDTTRQAEAIRALFQNVISTIGDWEIEGTFDKVD